MTTARAQIGPASTPLATYLEAALIEAIGVAVYTTDASGRITLFNEAAVDLWGRKPAIGKDLWCGSWRIFTPDGEPMPLDQCPMAIALRENRPVRDAEIIVERPDGTRANVLPYPTPLRDETGRLIGAVNVLVDITERKRAEETLSFVARLQSLVCVRGKFPVLCRNRTHFPCIRVFEAG